MKLLAVVFIAIGGALVLCSLYPPPAIVASPFERIVGVIAGATMMLNGLTCWRDS